MVILPPSPSMWPVNPFESETPDLNVFVHSQNKKKTNGFIVPKSKHQGCHLPFLKSQATNGIGRIVNISVLLLNMRKHSITLNLFGDIRDIFTLRFAFFTFLRILSFFKFLMARYGLFATFFQPWQTLKLGGERILKKESGQA